MEEYIRVNVVPEILKHYDNCMNSYKLTKCEIVPQKNMVNNWSSFLYTLDLNAVVENGDNSLDRHYSLFVKCMMDNCVIRSYEISKRQFSNEIHIYNIVQPIFKKLMYQNKVKLFMEAPYAIMKDIELKEYTEQTDGIVILENLEEQGYKLSPQKLLDMEHCVLALEQLGRWHGLSLLAKELDPEQFYDEIVARLRKCAWEKADDDRNRAICYPFIKRLSQNIERVKNSKTLSAVKILIEKFKDLSQYMTKILESSKRSKLSLLCHGDYCRNNILFKYSKTGVPMSAIPIDYQQAGYGSPALDISGFIYMSTEQEIRETHFMTLLKKYHASLVTTMEEFLINKTEKSTEEISAILPTLESIVEDYKQHGSYGMIHAINFVPILIASENEVHELISSVGDWNKYYDCAMNIGGEIATNAVVDIFDKGVSLNQITIE